MPYDSRMTWALDSTEDYDLWFESLADDEQERVVAAARMLRQDGPTLGRPLVDQIKMSRHANMKELRVRHIRVLFAFDPRQQAKLLLGGNKEGKWDSWYADNVPRADELFDRHLTKVQEELAEETNNAPQIQRCRRGNRSNS